MNTAHIFMLFISTLVLSACETDNGLPVNSGTSSTTESNEWLIPSDEVFDGGPGKDGIPALELPDFVGLNDLSNSYLSDDDLVLGYKSGDVVKAYPHPLLDWHEIINDQVSGEYVSITYCPLTGTGIGWDRVINGDITSFGVSGLLYNSNLLPYDRLTDSYWSQIRLDCVHGSLVGTAIRTVPLLETSWKQWKEMFPNSKVVSVETGYSRNYGNYPYGSYRTSSLLIFPVSTSDNSLHKKERVHGIVISDKARVYRFEDFGDSLTLINDLFQEREIIVAGIKNEFIVSFYTELPDGTELELSAVDGRLPVILRDENSGEWNIFGEAISGPYKGKKLESTVSFMGYWFSWASFYPDVEIFSPVE